MASNEKLAMAQIRQWCIIDRKPIAIERIIRRCITCSPECQKALRKHRNAVIDSRRCLHCYKPSTPADRAQFREFRLWLAREGRIVRPKTGRPVKNPGEPIPKAL